MLLRERSLARKRSIDDLYRSNPFKETEGKANEAKLDGNTKGNERHRYVQDSMQMKQSFKDEAPIEAANYKITNNRNFIRSSSTGDIKEFKIDYAFGSRVNPSDLHCTKPDARENENVIRNRNLENSYNPIKYNKSRMTKDNRIYDNGTRSTKSNNSSNMKNIFNLEKGSSRNINYDKIFNQPLNKFSAPDSTDSTFRRKKAPLKYDNKCGYLMI